MTMPEKGTKQVASVKIDPLNPNRFLPGMDFVSLNRNKFLYPLFGSVFVVTVLASYMTCHHMRHNPEIVVNKRGKSRNEPWQEYHNGRAWRIINHFDYVKNKAACPGPVLDLADYDLPVSLTED